MKTFVKQTCLTAVICILICVIGQFFTGGTYYAYHMIPYQYREAQSITVEMSGEGDGKVAIGEVQQKGDFVRIPVKAKGPGDVETEIRDGSGESIGLGFYRVDRFGMIYDYSTGGFTGDRIVMSAITLFVLAESVFLFLAFRRMKGSSFYSYSTIYAAGFSLFLLLTGILLLVGTIRHIIEPGYFNMKGMYGMLSSAGCNFMTMTFPFILVFAAAMTFSNLALLKHERPRLQNVLGILTSVLMIAGVIGVTVVFGRDFIGSEMEGRVRDTVRNVYCTAYAYFECMLLGAIICGLKAAGHVPEGPVDYIVILGCGFRKDGTLPPLLRGRVDRAISFWKEQKEKGKTPKLVPSGGQGANEVMAEAEAMRRYLISQDVPEECILPEKQSKNTYENMVFSKKLIENENKNARVIFSTTNYHVFRSGVWASLAGLDAEGIGSKTKWWFWPNAFMRECVGLLANRWKEELALLVFLVFVFGTMSMVL